MTSFKRWFGAGAIVLVALALVACPALVPEPVGKITPMTFTVGDAAQTISDIGDLFTNVNDRTEYEPESSDADVATASITGTTLTVTPGTKVGTATVTITATLDNGRSAKTSFMVTVKAAPPPPPVVPPPDTDNNQPRLIDDELPDVGDLKFRQDPPWTVDLAPLFTDDEHDDLTFTAMSRDNAVAMASVMGSTLTLTAARVAIGDLPATARIDVFADDGEHDVPVRESFSVTVVNQAPMKLTEGLSFNIGLRPGGTDSRSLTPYFMDPEGHALTYSASVDPSGVAMASVDGTTLTIVAGMTADDAIVTVTATDGPASGTTEFSLQVSAEPNNDPVAGESIPDQTLMLDFDATKTIDVMGHFSDPDGDMLTYTPASSMEDYVTVSADGSMITITAVAAGMSTITVTASDGRGGSAMSTFDVTVTAPAVPTWKKEIPDVTFEHDGGPQTFMLADYFNKATMYEAEVLGDGETVVTAAVNDEQTMLTLTRVGAGSAVVEITPSNSGGNGAAQSITVDVEADTGPALKKEFMNFRLAVADGSNTKDLDLTEYIEDPDGLAIKKYTTTTGDMKKVAVYKTGTAVDAGNSPLTGADLATFLGKTKAMVEGSTVTLHARATGSVTITVTATDFAGETKEWTFEVTVVTAANVAPTAVLTSFPGDDVDGNVYRDFATRGNARRFKSTDREPVRWKIDLGTMFSDTDVQRDARTTGDRWTFDVDSTDKDVVTVMLESTNNPEKPDEYNVVITPVGSGDATVWFKVTDLFGATAGTAETDVTSFPVRVNNRPMAQGSQETPWMLNDAMNEVVAEVRNMVASTTTATLIRVAPIASPTTDAERGFFSDKDEGDALRCRFSLGGDEAAAITWSTDREVLSVIPSKRGTRTVDVWCYDQVGTEDFERSDTMRLTVTVTADGSRH